MKLVLSDNNFILIGYRKNCTPIYVRAKDCSIEQRTLQYSIRAKDIPNEQNTLQYAAITRRIHNNIPPKKCNVVNKKVSKDKQ